MAKQSHGNNGDSTSVWKWKPKQVEKNGGKFLPVEFFESVYRTLESGPGGGIGMGCGVGVGFGLVGGVGYGGSAWNNVKLVFGVGAGCGIGLGFGYGQGFGRWSSLESMVESCRSKTKNKKSSKTGSSMFPSTTFG